MAALDPQRRELLNRAKLSALVRAHWGPVAEGATPAPFPGGASLLADHTLWVLAGDAPARGLGPALLVAVRRRARRLHVLADAATGTLARRAEVFRLPTEVWHVDGTSVRPAAAEELPPQPPVPTIAERFRPLLEQSGAEVVAEGGVLRAEARGLEVARVVVDESGAYLAVGVGKHDREAMRMVHGDDQGLRELVETVRFVTERRVAGAEGSPAYHLAGERWLRWLVVRRPELVGAAELVPAPSPVPREDLRHPAPAPASGVDQDGRPVLVVCSVGIDTDLVAAAADAWLADPRRPRIVLCLPEGDEPPPVRELARLMVPPAEVGAVPRHWRELADRVAQPPA